jgi:putative sterol carrier protein
MEPAACKRCDSEKNGGPLGWPDEIGEAIVATVSDITERLRAALVGEPALNKSLKIDFKGEGFIHVAGLAVTNDDAPADCTVIIAREDLEALARGQLDPMTAMMRGRLKIQGDMAVAMQLQSILRMA